MSNAAHQPPVGFMPDNPFSETIRSDAGHASKKNALQVGYMRLLGVIVIPFHIASVCDHTDTEPTLNLLRLQTRLPFHTMNI